MNQIFEMVIKTITVNNVSDIQREFLNNDKMKHKFDSKTYIGMNSILEMKNKRIFKYILEE